MEFLVLKVCKESVHYKASFINYQLARLQVWTKPEASENYEDINSWDSSKEYDGGIKCGNLQLIQIPQNIGWKHQGTNHGKRGDAEATQHRMSTSIKRTITGTVHCCRIVYTLNSCTFDILRLGAFWESSSWNSFFKFLYFEIRHFENRHFEILPFLSFDILTHHLVLHPHSIETLEWEQKPSLFKEEEKSISALPTFYTLLLSMWMMREKIGFRRNCSFSLVSRIFFFSRNSDCIQKKVVRETGNLTKFLRKVFSAQP